MIGQTEVPDDYIEDNSSIDHFNEDDLKREFALGRLPDLEVFNEYD